MEYLTLAMVWVLSGLFTTFLMRQVDESKGAANYEEGYEGYWLRNRSDRNLRIFMFVAFAPITLLFFGIFVMMDFDDE